MKYSKCNHCGHLQDYDFLNCQKCGQEMPDTSLEISQSRINTVFQDKKLTGVGGWLLFFCVNYIFSAIVYIISAFRIIENMSVFFFLFLIGIFHLFTVVYIFKEKQVAKTLAVISTLLPPNILWLFYIVMSERVKNTLVKS